MKRKSIMVLTLLHSERPNLYTILAFLSAIGFKDPTINYLFAFSSILTREEMDSWHQMPRSKTLWGTFSC